VKNNEELILENFSTLFMKEIEKNFPNLNKYESLIRKIFSHLLELWKNAKYKDRTHDVEHVLKVLEYSTYIVKKEKINLNEKKLLSLIISIIFHDVGLFFVKKPNEIDKTIEIFLEFYKNLDKKEKEILDKELIIKAIREHSFNKSKEQSNIISKILYDADKLDALGIRGFYRACVYDDENKRFLLDPKKNYKYYLSLFKKGQLTKEECKKIFNDKFYILDHFFIKLFWIKEKLNFNSSKELAKKLENDMFELIEKLQDKYLKN